jgi:hypothetical protein
MGSSQGFLNCEVEARGERGAVRIRAVARQWLRFQANLRQNS